jgi:hypothetical protein
MSSAAPQLMQPVSEMLNRISGFVSGDTLSEARSKIQDLPATIINQTDMIRGFAVDKIDSFQQKWLVATPDSEPAKAQNYANYAYYVSVQQPLSRG